MPLPKFSLQFAFSWSDYFSNRTESEFAGPHGITENQATYLHLVSSSIPIKERCVFVCLLFIGHTTFVHFAALPPSGR